MAAGTEQGAFRLNPWFEPGACTRPDPAPVRAFHRTLPEYAETPLHDCRGLAASLGIGRLFVKDESARFGLNAFKALGAAWAMHGLSAGRAGPLTVTTATDGNHGRAVAWAARRLGHEAVIYIPAHAAPARVERIRREGARVELVRGSYDDAVALAAKAAAANGWQVVADTGYEGNLDIPHRIAEGYATLFEESREELARMGIAAPDVVFIQAGVGALAQAAVQHIECLAPRPRLVIVEPVESDGLFTSIGSPGGRPTASRGRQDSIMAGLNCGAVSLTAWPVVRRGAELFMTVSDDIAREAMRRLARPSAGDPGVVAGESGAAGLAGLLAVLHLPEFDAAKRFLRLGPDSAVMVVNTEGATDPDAYRRIVGGEPGTAISR